MEAVVWVGGGLLVAIIFVQFVYERIDGKENLPKKDLFYIRGIVRKRFNYAVNELLALDLLEKAHAKGVSVEVLNREARVSPNWDKWVMNMMKLGA